MATPWKENWEETKSNFRKFWKRDGLVVTTSNWSNGILRPEGPIEEIPDMPVPLNQEESYKLPEWISNREQKKLAQYQYLLDDMPGANGLIGPGSLALYVGCIPGFGEHSVWYNHVEMDPDEYPELIADYSLEWARHQEALIDQLQKDSEGRFVVGFPDLVENIDIISSMRGPQNLMIDFYDRPEWIKEKVSQINKVYFEVYENMYKKIKMDDDSSFFWAYGVWGDGKTAKVQCDASAMISPEMFNEFVVPGLAEQCEWLDHSLYHLDGENAFCHLDSLLAIDALDAIEYQPVHTDGGNPKWWSDYKKILGAGKCLQIVNCKRKDVIPTLNEIGGKGVFLQVERIENEDDVQWLDEATREFR